MLQKLMRKMKKDDKGFTLVELMIVVVIIGILIAIAVPVYNSIQTNAETRACQANLRSLKSQLEVYKADASHNGHYPTAGTQYTAFLASYFNSPPTCPASGTYSYNATTGNVTCSISGHAL